MCLIRCALMTGRALVAPPAGARFARRELAAEVVPLPRFASQVLESSGKGKERPLEPQPPSKNVTIPLSRRS